MEDVKEKIEELMDALDADDYTKGVDWNGYEVYEPEYEEKDGEYPKLGVPLVVLVKDGKVRLTTTDESFEYLRYSQKQNAQRKSIDELRREAMETE